MEKEVEKSGNIFEGKVLRRLFQFVKPYKKKFYFLVALTIGVALLSPIRPILIQRAIDEHVTVGDLNGLTIIAVLLVGLIVFQTIINYAHTYLSGWVGQYVIRDIRTKLYRHILSLRLKFYDKTPIGRLVTRTVSDIETLAEVFSQGVAAIISDILLILIILGIMFSYHWQLSLVSLSTLPILIIATYIFA